jgi:hypothetical protein
VTVPWAGNYVVRAYADDGIVFEPADFTVTATEADRTGQP